MFNLSKLFKAVLAMTAAAGLLYAQAASAAEPKAKAKPAVEAKPAAEAKTPAPRTVELTVTEKGYEPSPLKLKKGEPVTLKITRKTEKTCATELILKDHNINAELPLDKTVEVSFTPTKTGELKYGCAMGQMIAGVFVVE
jgi:plastocyanin domain-containing protein